VGIALEWAHRSWYAGGMAFIRVIEPLEAGDELRAAYEEMRARPMPDVYRAPHGGPAGIIRAHSLDPQLLRITFGASASYRMHGALTWAETELIAASASRSNGCYY
jgi:hypothetical protein